jgi:hypothetical protein
MLERRAKSAHQSLRDEEEVEKPLQRFRRDAAGRDCGEDGNSSTTSAAHLLGAKSFVGCSAETKLIGEGSSRFIIFWRDRSSM